MRPQFLARGLLLGALVLFGCPVWAAIEAASPPMGWNSWDAYGFTLDEKAFKANATQLADLRSYGWTYAVIDEGWYMENPRGAKLAERNYQLNAAGLLIPSRKRYASAIDGAGFKPLADWVHSRGLRFGLHIVRGIPKQAVERNTPISGTDFHAAEAADTSETCPWDDGNFGVLDNPAGQAYYDSMIRLYAQWGVDFLKVDCISAHPFRASEIRQIHEAIRKAGRPIVLSLSPGPTPLEQAQFVKRNAQMWRIANDLWDGWRLDGDIHPAGFPVGVSSAFDNLAKWNAFAAPGAWPDADMLPFGALKPNPGWGVARDSRLTPDEMRTQFTLWAIARAPLILGANLTELDRATRGLITNRAVIRINQTSWASHPIALPAGFENYRLWQALAGPRARPTRYIAIFNLDDKPAHLSAPWAQLGLTGRHAARDLWSDEVRPISSELSVVLPPHGCAVFRVQ
ncbi:MAG TPA: glycoside hydrolase family 27 protein [Steroidobacteraceae bacterium]